MYRWLTFKKLLVISSLIATAIVIKYTWEMSSNARAAQGSFVYAWIWLFAVFFPLYTLTSKFQVFDKIANLKNLYVFYFLLVIVFACSQDIITDIVGSRIKTLMGSLILFLPIEALLIFRYLKQPNADEDEHSEFVFISYNHEDNRVAELVENALIDARIAVIRDKSNMLPGEQIREFIYESIKKSHTIISIVSAKSLDSTWVASETTMTLDHRKRLIACILENEVLEKEYTYNTILRIDHRIKQIDDLVENRLNTQTGMSDLIDERDRLLVLRANLDKIMARLKGAKYLDFSEQMRENSLQELVSTLKEA